MSQLLFEIGVEDLPALAIDQACLFIENYITEQLKILRLSYGSIEVLGTPRRLVLIIEDLALSQPDLEEEVLGPHINIAYQDQNLSKAGLGFIKSKNLDEKKIYKKITDKGEVIAGLKIEKGRKTKDILPELLLATMRAIPFKKRMRWDRSGESFCRPVIWLLLLLDGEVLPMQFADVKSNNLSRGHRFMSPENFTVTSKDQYLRDIKEKFVILSALEREKIFIKSAQEKLKNINTNFTADQELLSIVRNLVEYPYVILGKFSEKYLEIPAEILISEMKTHQKCFAVFDSTGAIMPYFIASAGTKPYDEEVFAKGNERVLRARFEDGAFYYELDIKKKLLEHADSLKSLVFERDLGSVHDKAVRITNLGIALAKACKLSEGEIYLIKQASFLLKADLTSGVVGQFPELQGVMGRIYAKNDGYSDDIQEIIETHYWPRFAEDKLPRLKSAAVLSISDRLDTLVGIIAIGKKPVGNKDPFALRRAGIGIVKLIINFGLSIDIKEMLNLALNNYSDLKNQAALLESEEFLLQRARGVLIEDLNNTHAVSLADSAMATKSSDLLDIFARARALASMQQKNPEEFSTLVQTFKRASNIVKKSPKEVLDKELKACLVLPVEKELLRAVEEVHKLLEKNLDKSSLESLSKSYGEMLSNIAMLKPKLDAFFDNVMVMVDDEKLKKARLALLGDIKEMADQIGDFTHL
jgi:glycyl-tRNA synthetase beta chain